MINKVLKCLISTSEVENFNNFGQNCQQAGTVLGQAQLKLELELC